MRAAKSLVTLGVFLIGGLLVVRLIVVVAAPHLLQIMASREMKAAGFGGARVERAWVDFDGVHFANIAVGEGDDITADDATIPMSAELVAGGVGRMIVTGAKVNGVPRPALPAAGEFAWPGFAVELRSAKWQLTPAIVLDLTVMTQPAAADGSARIAANGTARHSADLPAFAPLQLAAALVARGDALGGRVRLTDAGRLLDLRVDGEYRVLSGAGSAGVVSEPLTLSPGRGVADIAPGLARALGGPEHLPTGTLEGEAHLDWDGKTLLTSGKVELKDVAFARADGGTERVTGAVDLSSLWPPRLAASGGSLEIDPAVLRQVEQAMREWLGLGRIRERP